MPLFNTYWDFFNQFEMPLARMLAAMSTRGILVDGGRLEEYKKYLGEEQTDCLSKASNALGKKVVGVRYKDADEKTVCKIASPADIVEALGQLHISIPKTRRGGGQWADDKTGAEILQRIFAKTGNEFVWQVIRHREIQRMLGYANAALLDGVLYSTYKVTGTVGGRRSSSENYLGLGTNGQNLPKHSKMGVMYRRCLVARPGRVFLFCDQKGAEDWIVHGIIADVSGGNITRGIDEMFLGINRHRELAAKLFGKPVAQISKDSIEYFLGKKTRHAGNYGMRGETFSDSLASKGIHIPAEVLNQFLDKFHLAEPEIQGVFQRYVEGELVASRRLSTPIGRRRDFLSLRSYSDNSKVFRDAYSYIPQSTVGDNTGLAMLSYEKDRPSELITESHDSIGAEVPNDIDSICAAVAAMDKAFERTLTFPNGFSLRIPIEFEMGYDLGRMQTCGDLTRTGLQNTLSTLSPALNPPEDSTSGAQQPLSQQA